MTENMLEIAKHWEDGFEPKSQHHKENRIIWQRSLLNYFNFPTQKRKKKKKKTEAPIVYINPATLATKLTKFKKFIPNSF